MITQRLCVYVMTVSSQLSVDHGILQGISNGPTELKRVSAYVTIKSDECILMCGLEWP